MAHELEAIIAAGDEAINREDLDRVMTFYAEDASLVVKPGVIARGKPAIRRAMEAIAAHFHHELHVSQEAMTVVEGGDTALVLARTRVRAGSFDEQRRATYVFRRIEGTWLCVVDNSYGTELAG